jgi:type IV pilus assembly protein PilC
VAILILLVFVFPKFVGILEEAGEGLPLTTAILLTIGDVVGRFWWLLGALAAGAVLGFDRWRRTTAGRRRLARLDIEMPVWGGLRREAMAARFAHALALLLRNGVRLLPGLRTASKTVGNIEVAERLEAVASQVREGQTLSSALESQEVPFPDLAIRMIAVGEEGGALPDMLEKVATIFDQRVERRAERIVALLEPALIVAFGVAVGFVAVAMMQAVFRIQQAPL